MILFLLTAASGCTIVSAPAEPLSPFAPGLMGQEAAYGGARLELVWK